MSAIAGLIGGSDQISATATVTELLRAMHRRGPGGTTLNSWPGATLGYREFECAERARALGGRPMHAPAGDIGIVLDGTIYNCPELKRELGRHGSRSEDDNATEILLHGFRRWGINNLLRRVNGKFALAIWDTRTETLYLARDRLGVKPLAYSVQGGTLTFASTPRALRMAGVVGEISPAAVSEFLEFGFVTDGYSIYEGAHKVPAATIVEWRAGHLSQHEYWAPPTPAAGAAFPFAEAVERTESLLLQAVERRLDSGTNVGALLSGGIDSGLICWAAAELGRDLTAFTVGVPGDPLDESYRAIWTARALGLKHQVLEMSADDDAGIDDLIAAYPEPFACASALGLLKISRMIKPAAEILLTGDGGDDLFLGYDRHRYLLMAERLARLIPPRLAERWPELGRRLPPRGLIRRATNFMNYATGGLGAFTNAHDGLPFYTQRGILGERLGEAHVTQRDIAWSHEAARRVLSEYLEYDRHTQFVAEYMTKVDGATAYYALEARSPFLDHQLWEFASALPLDLRLHRLRLKAILRELARRKIGTRIARGRKQGFSIPIQRWIGGQLRPAAERIFSEPLLEQDGWIRVGALRRELAQAVDHGWAPLQLWYLFVLESWLRAEREAPTYAPAT